VFLEGHNFIIIKTTPEKIAEKLSFKSCHDDMEQLLVEFLAHNSRRIKTAFGTETCVDRFIKFNLLKICVAATFVLILSLSWFIYLESRISEEMAVLQILSKNFVTAGDPEGYLQVKIDAGNVDAVAQLVDFSGKNVNPLNILQKISDFLKENGISRIQGFQLTENSFKFKAQLSPSARNKLQRLSGNKWRITFEKEKTIAPKEYKEILPPKSRVTTKIDTVVCIEKK
jgi:hypothetical protein